MKCKLHIPSLTPTGRPRLARPRLAPVDRLTRRTGRGIRDIRAADPGATIVVTDHTNPSAPLIYPPRTQPPPPGRLPPGTPTSVPYP